MKRKIIIIFAITLITVLSFNVSRFNQVNASEKIIDINCKSYILMDKDSGAILSDYNSSARLPVASIIKLMTILLTCEHINNGELELQEKIAISENASGMGGSQVFLDANQEYSVQQLLKSVIICSANDSSVALAEYIAGSESLFVKMMNEKAMQLGLLDTNYENATGLPSPNQYSSAKDVAKVLREVLKFKEYSQYSKVWLEDFVHPSGRITEMTNTNKLSRFYDGCLGGKTGSTNEAKYCLSVGAKRNDMSLIAVVLGCENSNERFSASREILNYGFANFENKILFNNDNLTEIKVKMLGQNDYARLYASKSSNIIIEKGKEITVEYKYNLPNNLSSIKENEFVGKVDIIVNGEKYDTIDLLSTKTIEEPNYLDYFKRIQEDFLS